MNTDVASIGLNGTQATGIPYSATKGSTQRSSMTSASLGFYHYIYISAESSNQQSEGKLDVKQRHVVHIFFVCSFAS